MAVMKWPIGTFLAGTANEAGRNLRGRFLVVLDASQIDEELRRTIRHEIAHAVLFDLGSESSEGQVIKMLECWR